MQRFNALQYIAYGVAIKVNPLDASIGKGYQKSELLQFHSLYVSSVVWCVLLTYRERR